MDNGHARTLTATNKGTFLGGLALVGLGVAVAAAGVTICAFVGLSALRARIIQRHEDPNAVPPSDLALQQWKRFKTVGQAGYRSWRETVPSRAASE